MDMKGGRFLVGCAAMIWVGAPRIAVSREVSPLRLVPEPIPAGTAPVPRVSLAAVDDDEPDGPRRGVHRRRPYQTYDPLGPLEPAPPLVERPRSEPKLAPIVAAALWGGVGVGAVTLSLLGTRLSPWYGLAALEGWAVGAGVIVCAIGQTSPTRRGGCSSSIAGALLGTVGLVPGLVMLRLAASPCTIQGSNADDRCENQALIYALVGFIVGAGGYVAGTTTGASVGWKLGAAIRDPGPTSAVISIQALTIRF
jgi:hypothetical protein